MTCPKCGRPVEYQANPFKEGRHREMQCRCGQELQWDEPVTSSREGRITTGPPRACSHEELRKASARVPLP